MVKFRYIKGRGPVPITPRKVFSYSDLHDPRDREPKFYTPTLKELTDFAKMKSDLADKKGFERAKTIIKTSAPVIASFDPILATTYGLYRFGDFGFHFVYKVHQEYKTTRSYEKALRNVAERELKENVIAKFKSISLKNGSEFAGKSLWMHYKEKFPNEKIPEKLDRYAESALIQTFEEIGTKVF